MKPRQNGRHFADDIFKLIFLTENVWIVIKISLNFVPQGPINHIPTLVQIMAWRRPGDKSLSGLLMVGLPTHISVTRPQWVKVTIPTFECIQSMRLFICKAALHKRDYFEILQTLKAIGLTEIAGEQNDCDLWPASLHEQRQEEKIIFISGICSNHVLNKK